MIESEIKKLNESIINTNELLAQLIDLQRGLLTDGTVIHTADPASTVAVAEQATNQGTGTASAGNVPSGDHAPTPPSTPAVGGPPQGASPTEPKAGPVTGGPPGSPAPTPSAPSTPNVGGPPGSPAPTHTPEVAPEQVQRSPAPTPSGTMSDRAMVAMNLAARHTMAQGGGNAAQLTQEIISSAGVVSIAQATPEQLEMIIASFNAMGIN